MMVEEFEKRTGIKTSGRRVKTSTEQHTFAEICISTTKRKMR
jgi:hypothetical protein